MKKIMNFLTLIILVMMMGCTKDFIVKDIKTVTLKINSPSDTLKTQSNLITFWWDEVDGAEKYNLQIVKPNFNSILQLIVDTNVTINKFNHTFAPGTYQWRIKAFNSAGSTAYITRTFTVDSTSNLGLLTVNSLLPNTNYLTNNKAITFTWSSLYSATYYELEVKNNIGGAIIINPTNISGTSYTYTFTNTTDAYYSWRVKAYNSSTFSQYNTANTFTIDVTAPNASSITYPLYGNTVNSSTDSLKWTRGASIDTKSDSIIISLDSTFTTFIRSFKTYQTKFKVSNISPLLPSPSPTGNNYYWWRIISMDSVKNTSIPSPKYKFKLL